jgi:hypothetical protein
MPNPRKVGRRRRGRAGTFTKIAASFAAIAIIGAAAALTGASATPSVGPNGPTVKHLPPVAPAAFDGSVRSLPQLGASNKRDIPKPRAWQELEPFATQNKTTLPGAVDAPAAETIAAAPAPGPGSGAFAGTFPGLDSANWGAGWPPDTNGDVGPTYFIQAVNTSIGIFRKTDGARVAAFTFDALFSGTGTLCDNDNGGDPTVTYDPVHDRWFVADFAFTGDGSAPPYYECIAVSKTGDPVAGGWYFYAIRADDAAHPWFPDYPKMGIWPDGLYMTANMFGSSFAEVRGWAFNLDDMYSGAPVRSAVVDTNTTTYFSLLPSNMRTVAGAPPAGRPNLFVAESQTAFGLQVFKFHVDWSGSGSTFTGPTNVGHSGYTVAAATAPSPANPLDTLRERLMNSAQYANINGVESLWVNHTIRCCGTTNGPAGIQWIQVNVTGGNVGTTPIQQQVYPGASDGLHRWIGSVAVDKLGDMALGYSVSSSTLNPDIRYAGRLAGDPLGTLPQTETSMLPGVTRGTQLGNCGGSTCTRWGDYSGMTIDPNGCDFWFTTEYYSATGMNWQTRVGSFRLNPSCTTGGGQQSQTITFDPLSDKVYGDADFVVDATASSGLPVSFSASGNCTVSGSTVHLTGAGSCTVTASQAGDATYSAATPVSRTFAIGKAGQTISFGPLSDRTFGDPDFAVSATASSGLPVSFAASGQCTVSGSTVHLTASGSCTITASQTGNANYAAATSVPQTFTINPGQENPGTPLTLTSTVEGHLDFSSGAWVSGGFAVRLGQQNSAAVTVQLTGNVLLPVHCSDAAGAPAAATISVPVSTTVTIPARSTSWTPTSDQRSILGWMGALQAPAACGTGGVLHNTEGATLSATVVAGAHTGALTFQFHYRVPAAKGKPNTNCTVAGDPSHNAACQGKWSGTASI